MYNKLLMMYTIGGFGALITYLFGGWDASLQTLCVFMVLDYITGIICACLNKSQKTGTGGLNSSVGFRGLAKKLTMFIFVIIAVRLDMLAHTDYLRDGVCVAFIANEGLSIIENAGIIGIPIPKVITKAIDVLKGDDNNDKSDNKP